MCARATGCVFSFLFLVYCDSKVFFLCVCVLICLSVRPSMSVSSTDSPLYFVPPLCHSASPFFFINTFLPLPFPLFTLTHLPPRSPLLLLPLGPRLARTLRRMAHKRYLLVPEGRGGCLLDAHRQNRVTQENHAVMPWHRIPQTERTVSFGRVKHITK